MVDLLDLLWDFSKVPMQWFPSGPRRGARIFLVIAGGCER